MLLCRMEPCPLVNSSPRQLSLKTLQKCTKRDQEKYKLRLAYTYILVKAGAVTHIKYQSLRF